MCSAEILTSECSRVLNSGSWHSPFIYLLDSFSICYLILKLRSEFMATAGHCQELRSQILKVSPPIPSSPAPHTRLSIFPMAKPFFFWRFTSLYLENAMYVCNRIKEIISDGKQTTGLVLFCSCTLYIVVFTVFIHIFK